MSETITVDQLTRVVAGMIDALLEQTEGLTVYDTVVPGQRPQRYAFFNLRNLIGAARLGGRDDDEADWLLTVTSVGTTTDQARWVQAAVLRHLLDVRVSLPGWRSTPIQHTDSQPVDLDDTVMPPLPYAVDSFRWSSNRN